MAESIISREDFEARFQRYKKDGFELFVDLKANLALANLRAIARMVEQDTTTVRRFFRGDNIEPIKAEIPTRGGLQGVTLYTHKDLAKAAMKFKPDLAMKMLDCGAFVFVAGVCGAGIKSETSATPKYSILDAVSKEPLPWSRLFSDEWIDWAEKTSGYDWNWSVMGQFLHWAVYDYLPSGVVQKVAKYARNENGVRITKYHQHLEPPIRKLVLEHLDSVLSLMHGANGNQELFALLMKNKFGDYRPRKIDDGQLSLFRMQMVFEAVA